MHMCVYIHIYIYIYITLRGTQVPGMRTSARARDQLGRVSVGWNSDKTRSGEPFPSLRRSDLLSLSPCLLCSSASPLLLTGPFPLHPSPDPPFQACRGARRAGCGAASKPNLHGQHTKRARGKWFVWLQGSHAARQLGSQAAGQPGKRAATQQGKRTPRQPAATKGASQVTSLPGGCGASRKADRRPANGRQRLGLHVVQREPLAWVIGKMKKMRGCGHARALVMVALMKMAINKDAC